MKTTATLLAAALTLLVAGTANASDTGPESCCASPASQATTNFTDKSIYQTASKWTTDTGKRIKLGELKGKPQVVAMLFANCQYACPLIVNDMKRLEAALTPAQRRNVGFTLVSFDTKRDTSAALAAYRMAHALPAHNWTLLHGEPDDVLELAALLGVQFKEDENGQFAHSNVITILNAQGEIVRQQIGLNQDLKETVRILWQLAAR